MQSILQDLDLWKNYSNWIGAKISVEQLITNATKSDYPINNLDWSRNIENTLKIKKNNNLKEILNLRNNLYFNLKKSKMRKEITDTEKIKLAQCDGCDEEGSRYHCFTLFKRVTDIWNYILDIIKNFNNVTPSTTFFNSFCSPNIFHL